MSLLGQRRSRVSPRQAIVVIYRDQGDEWARPFAIPLILDVLGTLVAVNGASIIIISSTREGRRQIARVLPAGVELLTPPSNYTTIGWTYAEMTARGFNRIAFVAADVIGLPSRVMTTALSVVGSEGVIRGSTPEGGTYLLAICQESAPAEGFDVEFDSLDDERLSQTVKTTRGIERFPRLSEMSSVEALSEIASDKRDLLPRLNAEIARSARSDEKASDVDGDELA